jgi:competence protein ComER
MLPEDRARLKVLLGAISRPVDIREEDVRTASDISSCGPAFFAFLLEQFTEAAVRQSGLAREQAEVLAGEMLLGTARLLVEQGCSTRELQNRVSVPGGITAAALQTLRAETEGAFPALLRVTHGKFQEDLDRLEASLFQDHPREGRP